VGGEADDTPMLGGSGCDARRALVEKWCAEHTTDEICQTLHEAGIPSGPVRTIPEVAADPHLWEREMLVKKPDAVAGAMYLPGATIKFSKTPTPVGEVPTPGQHTDEVLGRLLGYDRHTLDSLRSAGTIA
jgi:crotonobetainyl-CoA:carnitine CoA-transferase CaiB-like acyl-CoA transferase